LLFNHLIFGIPFFVSEFCYLCNMDTPMLYRKYADLLAEFFPYKVQKLPVDAGFTCPNRDGTKGRGGCTYCVNRSFHPAYGKSVLPIREQLERGKAFFAHQYPEVKYLAYFQSFTGTYAPLSELQQKYEEALDTTDVVGLVISTRPDCLSDEVLEYLEQLNQRTLAMLEIGVESTDDAVLKAVNRQHTYAETEDAINRAIAHGIPVCAHVILGLGSFGTLTVSEEALRLSKLPISSVKIHQLQVLRGTALAKIYRENPQALHTFTLDEYLDELGVFVSHLRQDIAIERLVSQSPSDLLIAPRWGVKPDAFQKLFENYLVEKGIWQGKFFA